MNIQFYCLIVIYKLLITLRYAAHFEFLNRFNEVISLPARGFVDNRMLYVTINI